MKSKNTKTRKIRMRGGVRGTHEYPDNSMYVGNLVAGQRVGKGKITFPDGREYDGDWVNDKMEGKGTLTFENGDVYTGDFKEGKMDGKGTIQHINSRSRSGGVYTGEFKKGKFNGQGKYTYHDGSVYVGEFFNNLRQGQGKMTQMSEDGSYVVESYDGTWSHNLERGFGTRTQSGFWEGSIRNFDIKPWKSDADCENDKTIEDPVTQAKIKTDRGFRLEAEKYGNKENKKGRCYDAETIRRIEDNKGPMTRAKFTKKDENRIEDYKTKYPRTSDYLKKHLRTSHYLTKYLKKKSGADFYEDKEEDKDNDKDDDDDE